MLQLRDSRIRCRIRCCRIRCCRIRCHPNRPRARCTRTSWVVGRHLGVCRVRRSAFRPWTAGGQLAGRAVGLCVPAAVAAHNVRGSFCADRPRHSARRARLASRHFAYCGAPGAAAAASARRFPARCTPRTPSPKIPSPPRIASRRTRPRYGSMAKRQTSVPCGALLSFAAALAAPSRVAKSRNSRTMSSTSLLAGNHDVTPLGERNYLHGTLAVAEIVRVRP